VSGAGLTEAGHDVLCMDIDAERIANLRQGHAPIYEPGLDAMLVNNAERGLLSFTTSMVDAVEHVNAYQKTRLFEMLKNQFNNELAGKSIAIWGLSFKPNTDDMREAPSRVLIDALLESGASVRAQDPEAMTEVLRVYGDNEGFSVHDDPYDATTGVDALVLVTEWKLYWVPDFERLGEEMHQKILFDGRNLWRRSTARRTFYNNIRIST
jgi:UDPglucose 6-dehydrogenase